MPGLKIWNNAGVGTKMRQRQVAKKRAFTFPDQGRSKHSPKNLLKQFFRAFQAGESMHIERLFGPSSSYVIADAGDVGASWCGGDAIVQGLMQIRHQMGSRVNLQWGQITENDREASCHWILICKLPNGEDYLNSGELRILVDEGLIIKAEETLNLHVFRRLYDNEE
jgi:hypothetical protein